MTVTRMQPAKYGSPSRASRAYPAAMGCRARYGMVKTIITIAKMKESAGLPYRRRISSGGVTTPWRRPISQILRPMIQNVIAIKPVPKPIMGKNA